MAKFGAVALGTLARKAITVVDPRAGELNFDVRVLNEADEDEIEQGAEAFARKRNAEPTKTSPDKILFTGASPNPWRGNAHYERGYMHHTLKLACIDSESSQENPEPYFPTVDRIGQLQPETIRQIYWAQREFQGEQSLTIDKLKVDDIFAHVVEVAISKDAVPFARLEPHLQWTLHRILAVLCILSHGTKLLSSSDSVKKEIDSFAKGIREAVEAGKTIEPMGPAVSSDKVPVPLSRAAATLKGPSVAKRQDARVRRKKRVKATR